MYNHREIYHTGCNTDLEFAKDATPLILIFKKSLKLSNFKKQKLENSEGVMGMKHLGLLRGV